MCKVLKSLTEIRNKEGTKMRKLNGKDVIKVNIKDNIKVIKGFDTLLFTDNNVMSYPKLMDVLKDVEGSVFKLWVNGIKIFCFEDKDIFIKELVNFLSK
jgi:hypothetical protein